MNKNGEEKLENSDRMLIIVTVVTIIIVIGLWLLSYFLLKDHSDSCRSSFGDMFGAINTLFSGLAFAGIIMTILLQRKELMYQREELIDTKKEIRRSANAQEKSEIALNKQAANLKASAKLSALNTLLNYYDDKMKRMVQDKSHSSPLFQDYKNKRLDYITQIEEILNDKSV